MTSEMLVCAMQAVEPAKADLVGSKAVALAELCAAGFPVPEGYVVTANALDRALRDNGLDDSSSQQQIRDMRVPDEVSEAISRIDAALKGALTAVRSSAVDEDLAGHSYAGQYESVLNVSGAVEMQAAVRTCWASAFADRVSRYEAGRGVIGSRRIAVLIQRMVRADVAGVAFSANPVTGDRAQAWVSAGQGLGDRLVGGRSTPDEWLVGDVDAVRKSGRGGAITAAQALSVAALARRVADHFDTPQDIEWAIAGNQIWLLQARPITSLPDPPEEPVDVPPPGFWQRSANSHQSLSWMQRSQILPALNASVHHFLAYSLAGGVEFRVIGGWLYSRSRPLEPAEMQQRISRIVADVYADEPGKTLQRWPGEWLPDLAARIRRLRDGDRTELTDRQLVEQLQAAESIRDDAFDSRFRVIGAQALVLGELGVFCQDRLGWPTYEVFGLLTGLPSKATEPTYQLAQLARMARGRPALRAELQRIDDGTVTRLAHIDAEFADRFATYQADYGQRRMGFDIAEPTLAERPTFVLHRIAGQLLAGYDSDVEATAATAARDEAVLRARSALASASDEDRRHFERALGRAQQAYPLREDTDFVCHQAEAMVRYAMLEMGRRLARNGAILAEHDVFALERDEALEALHDGSTRQVVVATRAAELARTRPGPASYGISPPRPPQQTGDWMANLPPPVRSALSAAMWTWQVLRTDERGAGADTEIVGVAASAGRYTGPARIITSEAEFDKLTPGDVLVCSETNPQWSVLFPEIGALVTDTGGLLSHPAIIAREYRVPAVLATGNATQVLRDGQTITVDGSTGRVEMPEWAR